MTDPDEAPERDEPEPLDPAWCPECEAMVQPKLIDFGIGPWEQGSRTGWHHDWAVACPDCECTKLEESQPGTECRSCGEVEPCDEIGVCETCRRRLHNLEGSRL